KPNRRPPQIPPNNASGDRGGEKAKITPPLRRTAVERREDDHMSLRTAFIADSTVPSKSRTPELSGGAGCGDFKPRNAEMPAPSASPRGSPRWLFARILLTGSAAYPCLVANCAGLSETQYPAQFPLTR